MWIKTEMYTGRIVTDLTVHSKAEADAANAELKKYGSKQRWIQSYAELALFEQEDANVSNHVVR